MMLITSQPAWAGGGRLENSKTTHIMCRFDEPPDEAGRRRQKIPIREPQRSHLDTQAHIYPAILLQGKEIRKVTID